MIKKLYLFSFIIILSLSGCSTAYKQYRTAQNYQAEERYATAVILYDEFIERYPKSNLALQSKINRSESYYQLGMIALEKENFELARRFFFLANNEKADNEIDRCYYHFAQKAAENYSYNKVLEYFDFIEKYHPDSEFIPEILFKKVLIYANEFQNYSAAWLNYEKINRKFPENYFNKQAQIIMDSYIPTMISKAEKSFEDQPLLLVEELKKLNSCPTDFKDDINRKISDIFLRLAKNSTNNNNFLKAKTYYTKASIFNPEKKDFVTRKLRSICNDFIVKGNSLLEERKYTEAKDNFEATFDIIPNYKPAKKALSVLEKKEAASIEAAQLAKSGEDFLYKKNYEKAFKTFDKAFKLDALEKYREKRFLAKNHILIEKDPEAFARKIIKEHKKGDIIKKLELFKVNLFEKYDKEEIYMPGWRFILSYGQNKYEARYDIFIDEETYYFVWLINLENRKVIPLNNQTEENFGS